jgi:hypothetical protein
VELEPVKWDIHVDLRSVATIGHGFVENGLCLRSKSVIYGPSRLLFTFHLRYYHLRWTSWLILRSLALCYGPTWTVIFEAAMERRFHPLSLGATFLSIFISVRPPYWEMGYAGLNSSWQLISRSLQAVIFSSNVDNRHGRGAVRSWFWGLSTHSPSTTEPLGMGIVDLALHSSTDLRRLSHMRPGFWNSGRRDGGQFQEIRKIGHFFRIRRASNGNRIACAGSGASAETLGIGACLRSLASAACIR